MTRTVSFSFDTVEEKADYENYARQKLMSLSALAKMALGQYRTKNPLKKTRNGELAVLCEKKPIVSNTPAPTVPTGSGGMGTEVKIGDNGDGDSD